MCVRLYMNVCVEVQMPVALVLAALASQTIASYLAWVPGTVLRSRRPNALNH